MIMLTSKVQLLLSKLSVVMASFVMILSIQPWFIWGKNYVFVFLLCVFLLLRLILSVSGKCNLKNLSIATMFSLLFWYLWYGLFNASNTDKLEPLTLIFTKILPLVFIILMSYYEKKQVVSYTVKIFALILIISTLSYCLYLAGVPFRYELIEHPTNTFYKGFANFYLFILEAKFDAVEFLRFRSVFTEPGHVGMMCALYLYVNKYDLKKWYNIIMLFVLVISFSFAAYVLLILGWMIYIKAVKLSFRPIALAVFIAVLSAMLLEIYTITNENKGVVSTYIIERAMFDDKKGLVGNNRNDDYFLNFYDDFSSQYNYFTGIGREKFGQLFSGTPNSSYRNFIVQYGIIGLILFILIFFSVLLHCPTSLGIGLFILFFLSFIQRPYWDWEAQSYIYISAIYIYYYESKLKERSKININ